jgi:hypothetical protein
MLLVLVMALEAAAFAVLAVVHAGVPLLGIADPPAFATTVAEALVAAMFAFALAAIFARRRWARAAAFLAHAIAVAAIMMGMANLALAQAERAVANDYFYRVLLLVALLMLVFLLTPVATAALARVGEPQPARSTAAASGRP